METFGLHLCLELEDTEAVAMELGVDTEEGMEGIEEEALDSPSSCPSLALEVVDCLAS